jgi:ArsR family transcriptional regulator
MLPIQKVTACCEPLTTAPLGADGAAQLAGVLKVIADPTRLRVLSIIASAAPGEVCVCDLTQPLGLSQPTVSHHLKVMTAAGLLEREKRGVWAYYRVVPGAMNGLADLFAAQVQTPA